MAKYKADIKFRGIKEEKIFEKNEEFEMNVTRAEEIEANIKKAHPKIESVMTRLDKPEPKTEEKKPPTKKE